MSNGPYMVNQTRVVSDAYGDVTGDGIIDYVFLTATVSLSPSSYYMENITLNIEDGRSKEAHTITLNSAGNAGYQPTVCLVDITGNEVKDILIQIDSGGSGALTYDYIYSFVDHQAMLLFDFEQYNERNQYNVTYLDNYLVSIESLATGRVFIHTIIDRSLEYLEQIYDQNGNLKRPVEGMADGVSGFYPVDMIGEGVYDIQAYQGISGLYHADGLGYIINTLSWDGERMAIREQWFAFTGTDLAE